MCAHKKENLRTKREKKTLHRLHIRFSSQPWSAKVGAQGAGWNMPQFENWLVNYYMAQA